MKYDELNVFTDGGARGNPGPAAAGVVITTTGNQKVESFGKYLGTATNNQAEYQAVKLALETIKKYRPSKVNFAVDSELVVKQLNGQYRVKNAELQPLHRAVLRLAQSYQTTFRHVYRSENKLADQEVNRAIDTALAKDD